MTTCRDRQCFRRHGRCYKVTVVVGVVVVVVVVVVAIAVVQFNMRLIRTRRLPSRYSVLYNPIRNVCASRQRETKKKRKKKNSATCIFPDIASMNSGTEVCVFPPLCRRIARAVNESRALVEPKVVEILDPPPSVALSFGSSFSRINSLGRLCFGIRFAGPHLNSHTPS